MWIVYTHAFVCLVLWEMLRSSPATHDSKCPGMPVGDLLGRRVKNLRSVEIRRYKPPAAQPSIGREATRRVGWQDEC